MDVSAPRNRICTYICCKRKAIVPPESRCDRNISFLAKEMMIPDIYCSDVLIPNVRQVVSQCEEPEDVDVGNYLFNVLKFGMNSVDKSEHDRMIQRIGAGNYDCSIQHIIANGTKTVASACNAMFDLNISSVEDIDCATTNSNEIQLYHRIMIGCSLPFFVATFIIYAIIPELKNLHGLILRSYLACTVIQSTLYIVPKSEFGPICAVVMAMLQFFSLMASFFWLNVMCFDIWWTFRSLQDSSKQRYRKRFIIYSIYAWGFAALMVGLFIYTAWAGSIPADLTVVYCLTIPVAVTTVFNLCFFVLTAVKIIQHKKNTARQLGGSENQRHNDEKQRFNIYLKLFTVMGLAWAEDLLTSFLNLPKCGWVVYLMYILQIPTLLQGFVIFVIFVWTGKIKRLLWKRLGWKGTPSSQTARIPRDSSR